MACYSIPYGCMGLVGEKWIATESEYYEYLEVNEE